MSLYRQQENWENPPDTSAEDAGWEAAEEARVEWLDVNRSAIYSLYREYIAECRAAFERASGGLEIDEFDVPECSIIDLYKET